VTRYETVPRDQLADIHRRNPDAHCWKVAHIGRPCGPDCLVIREAEPAVHPITLHICDLCLSGAGGECHVPGCSFWCHTAPTGGVLTALQGAVATHRLIEEARQ
jgi:hypothetical protein